MSARPGPHPLHEVRLVFSVLGVRVSNVYHVGEMTPHYVHDNNIDLGAAFLSWLNDGYELSGSPRALMGSDAALLQEIVFVAGLLLEEPILGDILDLFGLGLAEQASLPNSLSYALEWVTGYSGRNMHGRTFLVGVPQGSLDGSNQNELTADYLNKVELAYTGLVDMVHNLGPTPGGLTLALLHHAPAVPARGPDPWWTPITGCRLPKHQVGSQRERLPIG